MFFTIELTLKNSNRFFLLARKSIAQEIRSTCCLSHWCGKQRSQVLGVLYSTRLNHFILVVNANPLWSGFTWETHLIVGGLLIEVFQFDCSLWNLIMPSHCLSLTVAEDFKPCLRRFSSCIAVYWVHIPMHWQIPLLWKKQIWLRSSHFCFKNVLVIVVIVRLL